MRPPLVHRRVGMDRCVGRGEREGVVVKGREAPVDVAVGYGAVPEAAVRAVPPVHRGPYGLDGWMDG